MPFHIVRNDIAAMTVDAIVNTANPMPVVGEGVDAAIHEKAGPQLLAARKKIGRLDPGDCAVTPGFDLNANYVIHAVAPRWRGGLLGEGKLLRKCYESALRLAKAHGCESVAFPLIAAGNYGFPRERAMSIATTAISAFLLQNEMTVYLVVYDRESFRLSGQLFDRVTSYIDENYIESKPAPAMPMAARMREERDACASYRAPVAEDTLECAVCSRSLAPCDGLPSPSLSELLEQTDAGFSESLLKLIDATGKKDSEIYKKANLSKQHFSKIRNDPGYKPTKATALALALALQLDLEQTRDLIGRAGYALTRASKFDVIIMYFIERRSYDIMEINMTLFEFDQPLLGA